MYEFSIFTLEKLHQKKIPDLTKLKKNDSLKRHNKIRNTSESSYKKIIFS